MTKWYVLFIASAVTYTGIIFGDSIISGIAALPAVFEIARVSLPVLIIGFLFYVAGKWFKEVSVVVLGAAVTGLAFVIIPVSSVL